MQPRPRGPHQPPPQPAPYRLPLSLDQRRAYLSNAVGWELAAGRRVDHGPTCKP